MWSAVGVVAVIAGATLAITRPWESGATGLTPEQAGFTHYANAVDFPSSDVKWIPQGQGLQRLVPDGSCALAVGGFEGGAGNTAAYWAPTADCHRLSLGVRTDDQSPDGPPYGSHGGGPALRAAVLAKDGTLYAVGDNQVDNDYFASSGFVDRRSPDDQVTAMATVDPPENANTDWQDEKGFVAFDAVAMVGDRLLIGGAQSEPKTDGRPKLWQSTDGGKTLTEVPLPTMSATEGDIEQIGVHGDTVLAIGSGGPDGSRSAQLLSWLSGDAGKTWSRVLAAPPGQNFLLSGLAYGNGQWFASGEVQGADRPRPVVLSSQDARHWDPTWLPDQGGGGQATGVAVDSTGTPIVVGYTGVPRPTVTGDESDESEADKEKAAKLADISCGAIWVVSPPATWEDLSTGCTGAPPAAVTTLADGRVLVAGNSDLWIRGSVGDRG